jgi:hypothetical protein
MSSIDGLNLQLVSQDSGEELRERLRGLGARPFYQQVVQSPWSVVYDADLLHQEVKTRVVQVVDGCSQKGAIRCLTITAPPGYGKTHLLAWNRQRLEHSRGAVFIYIPPYAPDGGTFESHVLRAALDALLLHSPWQRDLLNENVRTLLVEAYDEYVSSGRPLSSLRRGSFWRRLLRPLSLRIGTRGVEEQRAALQSAFRHRDLLEFAFHRFAEQHPAGAEGLRTDWDSFVALAQLLCGNATQHWHAKQWLQNEPMPPEVRAPYHLRELCQGSDKVRNSLFTLMHFVGLPFCLALDQVEDTINAVLKHPAKPWDVLTQLLVRLSGVPRFSLLFFVQASFWQELSSNIPPMLRDRITEGHGVQRLRPLDDTVAQAVVRARMDGFVWRELASERTVPPPEQPLFPFTVEEVHQLRIDANSELRPFLRLLQDRYERRIAVFRVPAPLISAILPEQVPPHEPTVVQIQGNHFQPEVLVFLNGRPITPVLPQPNEGSTEVIEITTPIGLLGEVEVRVQAADDPQRFATAKLLFVDPPPRPYAQHVDREKIKKRRLELGMSPGGLGAEAGVSGGWLGRFERNSWNPSDDVIERIVSALGGTVADFRKDAPGAGE